jgi:CMP-N-acetylneuraminic acid synthetase
MHDLSIISFARMNSKRFPGKNIHPLNGKPLIQYTIDTMKYIRKLAYCKPVIFTDSKEIFNIAKENQILCIYDTEKCNYDDMRLHYWAHDVLLTSNFCLLQPTNPIRNNNKIMSWIEQCSKNNYKSAFSVYQKEPGHFVMNGSFFYYSIDMLKKENKRIYDNNSMIFIDDYYFDIDTKEDLIKTEEFIKNEK